MKNERLSLRRWQESDAADLLELHRDADLRRSGLPYFETPEECAKIIGHWANDAHHRVIVCAEDRSFAGYISLGDMNRYEGYVELEYAIAPQHRNKGFATEALNRMVEYGFHRLDAQVIAAWVRSHNQSSVRVLEKCGFTLEGRLRKHARDGSDTLCYSILREEWASHP